MKRLTMLRWPAVALVLLLVMVPAESSSQSSGDISQGAGGTAPFELNGNGLDDLLVFGHENDGPARGPMYQAWSESGALLASQFLLDDHTNFQFFTADVIPGGTDEVVIGAYRESDGAFRIEVRAAGGALLAGKYVTGATVSRHQIFPIDIAAHAGVEIGIGYAFEADNVAGYQIWRRNGTTLTMTSTKSVLGKIFTGHQWGSCDFNNDGSGDVFVGAERTSDRAGVYVMRDGTTTNAIVSGKYVSGSPFYRHQWMCADFYPSPLGDEIAHTMSRRSDNAAVLQVWSNAGAQLASKFIDGGAFDDHTWKVAQNDTSGGDCCPELVVLKRRPSDHTHAFQMWDPNAGPSLLGSQFVNGPAVSVTDWTVGDFNTNTNDGEEIAVVYARESDGAVGFSVFQNTGGAAVFGRYIVGTGWVGPQIFSIWRGTHHDMSFVLQSETGGAPQLISWHPPAASPNFSTPVLNANVITP